jgi:hypothetical protein
MKFTETDAYFVYRPNCASCRILYRMFRNELINADFCQSQPSSSSRVTPKYLHAETLFSKVSLQSVDTGAPTHT